MNSAVKREPEVGEVSCRTAAAPVVPVNLIVPTLKRGKYLRRCLESIFRQTVAPSEVLVGIRADDSESRDVVKDIAVKYPVRCVEARGVGVIGSMSSCLAETREAFVGLIDDDVELASDWLETMLKHLESNYDVLGAAGRDFLQDQPEMRRSEMRVMDVGVMHWYGRNSGNHHRGAGGPRRVDILRGSNCLFRGAFLRSVGFEKRLLGSGAQVDWELALALQAIQRKKRLFYDPTVEVIHHVAPRHDADCLQRGGFDQRATYECAFNEAFVIGIHAANPRRWIARVYQVVCGNPLAPGIYHAVFQAARGDRWLKARLAATIKGRLDGIRNARATLKG